jgi:hypothetical protein
MSEIYQNIIVAIIYGRLRKRTLNLVVMMVVVVNPLLAISQIPFIYKK